MRGSTKHEVQPAKKKRGIMHIPGYIGRAIQLVFTAINALASYVLIALSYLVQWSLQFFILSPLGQLIGWIYSYSERQQYKRTTSRFLRVMKSTENYATFLSTATSLDGYCGVAEWRSEAPPEHVCSAIGLLTDAYQAQHLAQRGHMDSIKMFLNTTLTRNAHGMTDPSLYNFFTEGKLCIRDYIDSMEALIGVFSGSRERYQAGPTIHPCWLSRGTTVIAVRQLAESTAKGKAPPPRSITAGDAPIAVLPEPSKYQLSLRHLSTSGSSAASRSSYPPERVLTELKTMLTTFGRTALVLSGGSSLGTYHTGVIRGLFEAHVLPEIIAGSSAGSIIAALVCTKRRDELEQFIITDFLAADALQLTPFGDDVGVVEKLRRLFKTGFLMDIRSLMKCMRANCGDMTFLEAYKLSGKALNVCVTRDGQDGAHVDRHVLLNYLTAPHVTIWSAVSASCAYPGLFPAVQLIEKIPDADEFRPYLPGELWCDGSVSQDIPRHRLAELFHVNYIIVSQVNPFVIPFVRAPPSYLIATPHRVRSSLLGRLYHFTMRQFRHWLMSMFDAGFLSKSGSLELTYLLLTQSYMGNVTILPVGNTLSSLPDYLNLVNNPSSDYIGFVASRAQSRTWPVVHRIACATAIERALVREIKHLEEKLNAPLPEESSLVL